MATALAMPLSQMGPGVQTSSAAGLVALLEEEDNTLRQHALKKLAEVVDYYWAEVASAVPLIEELSEDISFPARELAAAVASKCFFHLEEYNDALRLALGAGLYFDVSLKTEYVSTLVSRCIDQYVELRCAPEEQTIDPRMESIVERMFDRCFNDKAWTQAMGIALEGRRLDKVEETIKRADDKAAILQYTFDVCQTLVSSREVRMKVLRVLVKAHRELPNPDHVAVCQCLQFLDESRLVAEVLKKLCRDTGMEGGRADTDVLLAYQIACDLVDSENQHFIMDVNKFLPIKAPPAEPIGVEETKEGDGPKESSAEISENAAQKQGVVPEPAPLPVEPEEGTDVFWERMDKLRHILVGGFGNDLSLNFMYKYTQTDVQILKNLMTAVEARNSVLHNATVVAHALMNSGTTVDTFLRDNLDWMGRAANWAKFTATASIGVVHKGHMRESMTLLQPYLPQGGVSTSPYSEGGALYALGLIHANNGGMEAAASTTESGGAGGGSGSGEVINYLAATVQNGGTNETILHGACLGLGLAAMATGAEPLYEHLKSTLYMDSAVAGEAAAISIGLLMLGVGTSTRVSASAVQDMITYAHDTQHEKIIRGLAMGIALSMYAQEEKAEGVIEQLSRDRDPLLRYGAMYTIGLAYCGTANNSAVRRLLHVAVSDVSDDVRLAAVTCLGFVLFRMPSQVPRLVGLLAESFNPHVRYGSCMAIAVSCAGTASREAMDVLEPLMDDVVDFVRQGALMGMAMVLMQASEGRVPKVKSFRARLATIVGDKHQTVMTKMGAILATGILDAGGRNVTITMQSRAGFTRMASVVGLAMWCQHWYWYPLMHFLSLAFSPTMIIGLNKELKMPRQWHVVCNSRPSLFAYPKKLEEKKEEKKERVTTVTLSTTAKSKAREHRKELEKKREEGGAMDTTSVPSTPVPPVGVDAKPVDEKTEKSDKMDVDSTAKTGEASVPENEEKTVSGTEEGGASAAEKPKKREPEPTTYVCGNPSRITPTQEQYVEFDANQRYMPVRNIGSGSSRSPGGIILLIDTAPADAEDLVPMDAPGGGEGGEEAPMPEPFEWSS